MKTRNYWSWFSRTVFQVTFHILSVFVLTFALYSLRFLYFSNAIIVIVFVVTTEHLCENPELLPQIYKLGSYKVDQIKKEEARLAEDNKAVVEQTQDLAITNYKTFIQTSECSRRIYTEFKGTEQQLDQLIDKLPNLTEKCEKFIKTSSEIATSRRLNSLTLRRNAQLLEILELPQLMDTCIYQGKYEEALELAAHVQRMGAKHCDIPVINVSLGWKSHLWFLIIFDFFFQWF